MTIRYKCPRCDKNIEAPDDAAGRSMTCPSCLENHRVPSQPKPAVSTASATPQSPPPPQTHQTPGVIQETMSVQCAKCGHIENNVVFRPGMKCPACGVDAVGPVVDTAGDADAKKNWLLGVSILKLPRWAILATAAAVIVLSLTIGWLLSLIGSGEGSMSDVVMACPKCSRHYHVDADDVSPMCGKCNVKLEKGYVCMDCKKVFAASGAGRDSAGRMSCPQCKSANVRGLEKKVLQNLNLK